MALDKKIQLSLYEWDNIRAKAKKVLIQIGHDIPLVRKETDDTEMANIEQEESYVDINPERKKDS